MGLLEGQATIVTGAGSPRGIGLATARLFAAEGARVALLDLEAQDPESAAKSLGSEHLGMVCDVRVAEACHAAVEKVVATFGQVDSFVGNAGVVFGTPLLQIEAAEFDEVIGVNLRGNFQMAQAVVPTMRRQGRGAIVLVSSIAGQVGGGLFGRSHYAAAKAGLFGLTKALARELAPDGIRANAIASGVIDNDFTQGRMTAEDKARIADQVPLGRLGSSEEVAKVCLFLASDLSSYVTGSVLSVNGGLLMS